MFKSKWFFAVILALPLCVLSGLTFYQVWQQNRLPVWRLPITGYDPRDILRGDYLQFAFDFPDLKNGLPITPGQNGCVCLKGAANFVPTTITPHQASWFTSCDDPILAQCAAVLPGMYQNEGRVFAHNLNKIYVAENKAQAYEEKLRNNTPAYVDVVFIAGNKPTLKDWGWVN